MKQKSKNINSHHMSIINREGWGIDYQTWAETNIPLYTKRIHELEDCYLLHTNSVEENLELEMFVTATDKTFTKWYYYIRAVSHIIFMTRDDLMYGDYNSAKHGEFYPTAEKAMIAAEKKGEKLDFLDVNRIRQLVRKDRKELVLFYCKRRNLKII